MKYVSYFVILSVMAAMVWSTNNCVHAIFVSKSGPQVQIAHAPVRIQENDILPSKIEQLLGS